MATFPGCSMQPVQGGRALQKPTETGKPGPLVFPQEVKQMGDTSVCTAAVLCLFPIVHLEMLMCITRLLFSLSGDIGCSQFL